MRPFFTASFLLPVVVLASGCHDADDNIGKYCRYKDQTAFRGAASIFCSGMSGLIVPEGSEWGGKYTHVPDGYGGEQIFYGKIQVDRDGDREVDFAECMAYMDQIYSDCEGHGGWSTPSWGTVFGECIRI